MAKKRVIAKKFKSEKEEADWWDRNRDRISRDLAEAAKSGDLRVLNKQTLLARLAANKQRVISIRLPEGDLALARRQAERKRLPYQTYIKSLLHEALRRAE